jgi:hypothetical protein
MAAKKAASRVVAASSTTTASGDQKYVNDAYGEAVKRQVDTYFINCIDGVSAPEKRFLRGLAIIRDARQRALQLVEKAE